MYRHVEAIDACVCSSGAMDDFETLTDEQLWENMRAKLMGQVNLVLTERRGRTNRTIFRVYR